MLKAIQIFEIEQGSISGGRYKITVKFRGKVVDTFIEKTMYRAQRTFQDAGYHLIAWTEGERIILQKEN